MPPVQGNSPVSPAPLEALSEPASTDALTASTQASVSAPTDLWLRIAADLTWQTLENDQVTDARQRYLKQSNYLPMIASRADYYLFYIVEEIEKRGMPMEIALLPLVESTLDPFASSSSSAAGLWQIMPATGRHLGLQQDWWYDGRQDVRDSTHAALDYLEGLHNDFEGDWLLALAAYNCGKGRVNRAMKKNTQEGLQTDYWSLQLPRETRNYIPKLIALSQIMSDPQRYGVSIPPVANAPSFEVASTGGPLELAKAADLAGVPPETLHALNPGQLRWATSPDAAPELLLPVGARDQFEQAVAKLPSGERIRWQRYLIKRGDNLIAIAQRFNTQVGLLQQLNHISGSRIRAGNTLLIPQNGAGGSNLAMTPTDRGTTRQGYRVRSGDSLYRIAGRFNVSIDDIINWNTLNPDKYLQPGQELTLYVRGG